MKLASLALVALIAPVSAFVPPKHHVATATATSTMTSLHMAALSPGDSVMLIGPGFLQLVLAKTAKKAGLRPIVVAPQAKLDKLGALIGDSRIMADATIGMPEVGEPGFGDIGAVVFCSEDAVLGPSIISAVLDYTDKGQSPFLNNGNLKKVLCCAPVSNKVQQEKSMGWMPVFNSDDKNEKIWKSFVDAYLAHPKRGRLVRYGSLLGGSVDGPDILKDIGLDERMYKMTLEQYRDLKERAFDRYRLGVQILPGDSINPQPPNQLKMEKEGLSKDEYREAFRVVGGYPEVDRTNRHSLAQAIVQHLFREDKDDNEQLHKEFTVLSKCTQAFPSAEEWDQLFRNPGPATWPDPYAFDPSAYGLNQKK